MMRKHASSEASSQNKKSLEKKLSQYGIDDINPSSGNDTGKRIPITAGEAAERTLVLLAISFAAYSSDESDKVMDWLKKEDIWKAVTEKEKAFFRNPSPAEEDKAMLSWRFEAAYMLAWSLDEVPEPANAVKECSENEVSEFFNRIPSIGMPANEFCINARFRNPGEIIDSYTFYEKINDYLEDMHTGGKENTSGIHIKTSAERLRALRWLAGFEEKNNWDEITAEEDED